MTDTLYRLLVEAADEGFADFCAWIGRSWIMTEKDRMSSEPQESEEFMRGWNAACEGISAAWDCYKEEEK